MENKYKYEGVVDIDEVLINLYKEKRKSLKYIRATLEMHNKGMSPLEIANSLSAREGVGHIQSSRVISWLEAAKVKPNPKKYKNRRIGYKLLDEVFFKNLIISMMGEGLSAMSALREQYGGIVTYSDSTTEKIESTYILKKLIDMAEEKYLK